MRDYAKEIKKTKENICEIEEIIENLYIRRSELYFKYGYFVVNPNAFYIKDHSDLEYMGVLLDANELYRRIGNDIKKYISMINEENVKLDIFQDLYRKAHTREFYRPMDEIDICEIIHNNGSIRGVRI